MTMTKTVLCYGIILGLYCLVHGVCSYGDDQTVQHSDFRPRGVGPAIPKDKIFIKSETPLRGRKIHQTAWSEEVTEDGPEEFKMDDSWNFQKLYSYLKSLIYKTEEMEKARMTPSETVAMIRDKIKSEIKARKNSKRLPDFETSHSDSRIENSEESDESYEPCEDEDSSSEMYENGENKGNTKHKEKKENGSEDEDCYEDDEESDEKSSLTLETAKTDAKTHVVKNEKTSLKTKIAKDRKLSESRAKSDQQSGHEIVILNGTDTKDEKPKNTHQKSTSTTMKGSKTNFTDISSASKKTVKTNTDILVDSSREARIAKPTTSSNVHESTDINHLPTSSGHEKLVDQFIPTQPDIQDKVYFNIATESNIQEAQSKLNTNSVAFQKEIMVSKDNHGLPNPQEIATHSESTAETLRQDNYEVIITAPEFIPIKNKEIANTDVPLNKITEVKANMDTMLSMPLDTAHVYGTQGVVQKFDNDQTEVASLSKLQNQGAIETQPITSLEAADKTRIENSMVIAQENYNNMGSSYLQQESFFDNGRVDAMALNETTEVKAYEDKMLSMPLEAAHIYGKQSEAQTFDEFKIDKTEVSSLSKLQNQEASETQSMTFLDTAVKTGIDNSVVIAQENYNMESNSFQKESFFDDGRANAILEEYNLKNEFVELSDTNKNEFMNIIRDYNTKKQKTVEESQLSSMSQNGEFNEENATQESFDTILEYLYKHSNNPLILSLRNSNKTLF